MEMTLLEQIEAYGQGKIDKRPSMPIHCSVAFAAGQVTGIVTEVMKSLPGVEGMCTSFHAGHSRTVLEYRLKKLERELQKSQVAKAAEKQGILSDLGGAALSKT